MIAIGIVFMILGFVFMIPSGTVPGSVAFRNVRIGTSYIVKTPGHQDEYVRRRRWLKVLIGLGSEP